MSQFYLGVDGGGTKTVAIVTDDSGQIIGAARSGGSNYQSIGTRAASAELRAAVDLALKRANIRVEDLTAAAFGVAGADRDEERKIVDTMIADIWPIEKRFVENDALLVLRAATKDAVGVGLVAGTGTNCVGRDRYGRRHQIGGMGEVSGDVGYAEDLAMRTVGGAWMATDGRIGPSSLTKAVPAALGLGRVEDVPRILVRNVLPEPAVRKLVTCLFEQARSGDGLSTRIIEDTGSRLGAAAAALMRALVLRGGNAVVVLGGAMFQAPGHEPLVDATERRIRNTVNEAHVVRLEVHPVIGAALFARDLYNHAPLDFAARLRGESARIEEICGGAEAS